MVRLSVVFTRLLVSESCILTDGATRTPRMFVLGGRKEGRLGLCQMYFYRLSFLSNNNKTESRVKNEEGKKNFFG